MAVFFNKLEHFEDFGVDSVFPINCNQWWEDRRRDYFAENMLKLIHRQEKSPGAVRVQAMGSDDLPWGDIFDYMLCFLAMAPRKAFNIYCERPDLARKRIVPRYIGADFDGTTVTADYPATGKPIGAEPRLKALVEFGHPLILHTCRENVLKSRSTSAGFYLEPGQMLLDEAVAWYVDRDIHLFGVNFNPHDGPAMARKAHCHLYMDDRAAGAPLKMDPAVSREPFIDWRAMDKILVEGGYLPPCWLEVAPLVEKFERK
jgi:hypothetical protein